jgi:hypothetical protein
MHAAAGFFPQMRLAPNPAAQRTDSEGPVRNSVTSCHAARRRLTLQAPAQRERPAQEQHEKSGSDMQSACLSAVSLLIFIALCLRLRAEQTIVAKILEQA